MSSAKSNSVPSPDSVHDVWLRQRTELENDLFDGWQPITSNMSAPLIVQMTPIVEAPAGHITAFPRHCSPGPCGLDDPQNVDESTEPQGLGLQANEPQAGTLDADKTQHAEWLKQANDGALRQRIEHQRRVEESLIQQREAFSQDLARLRTAFEQELSARDAA